MRTFINPFTDFGFKRIFGQEDSKDILIGFLNALFEGEYVIKDLEYLDKERLSRTPDGRNMIYDIFCTTDDGRRMIIEMQNKTQVNFTKRALYYIADAIIGQARKGAGWRYEFCPVIGIYFMNFTSDVLEEHCRTDIYLTSTRKHKRFTNDLRLIFLQMPRFEKTEAQCATDLQKWMYIMNHMEKLDDIPWKVEIDLFEKLEEMSKIAAMTAEERAQYEAYLKTYRDNCVVHEAAILEGRAEGRKESKLEVARSMMAEGLDYALISRVTGLSLTDIENLR